jgi:hypothetical protein
MLIWPQTRSEDCRDENNPFPLPQIEPRATRRNIPEYGILHSHSCENLKSYEPQFLYWSSHNLVAQPAL